MVGTHKSLLGFRTTLAAVLATAASSMAGTLVTQDSYGTDSLGGGEFKVISFTGGSLPAAGANVLDLRGTDSLLQTFCIEYNEHIRHNTTFYWELNTGAITGGPGATQDLTTYYGGHGSGDPISSMTAYLYSQFYNGTLSDYDYGPNNTTNAARESDGYDLQRVIWYLEDEPNGDVSVGQRKKWYDEAVAAVSSGQWSGIGNVRVLNLYFDEAMTLKAQDQLVVVPFPGVGAASFGLLGGIGIFGWLRRRKADLD